MRNKRLVCGTAAFILAAVLLSMQLGCHAADSLGMARKAVLAALDELGFPLEEAITVSTVDKGTAADIRALEDCCIIGHSHAVGMRMTLDIAGLDYIAEVGMTAENMLYHGGFALPDGSTGGLRRGLESRSYRRVFVLLGTNDMIGGTAYLPVFKSSMETLLDTVSELQPEAEICLLSVAPLGKSFQEFCYYNYGLTPEVMDDYNYALRSIAVNRGIDYLNITTPLSGEDGFIAAEYDRGDGLHFNTEGNQVIINTILTHMGA